MMHGTTRGSRRCRAVGRSRPFLRRGPDGVLFAALPPHVHPDASHDWPVTKPWTVGRRCCSLAARKRVLVDVGSLRLGRRVPGFGFGDAGRPRSEECRGHLRWRDPRRSDGWRWLCLRRADTSARRVAGKASGRRRVSDRGRVRGRSVRPPAAARLGEAMLGPMSPGPDPMPEQWARV
jgi:hypothetical protein